MTKQELLDTIALLERMRDLKNLWVEAPTDDPVTEMSLFLMKRHLTGRMTTPTSLAQSANVPYTTATRRVSEMQDLGLLDLRPRTKTGRSFSVHPSPKLITKMTSYLISTRAAIVASSAVKAAPKQSRRNQEDSDFIGAPSIARSRLGFGGGLDILVLNDPAYSIGKPLRRELSYLMGGQVRFSETSIDRLRDEVLENAGRPQSKYDVVAVDLPMIAEFASRGVLAPLDDVAADSNVNSADFVSAAWRSAIVGEKQYAIPILINPQLLFYRRDLFSELGVPPPATTPELLTRARVLHNPASGQYGVSWTGAHGAPVGQAFVQFLADFGQPVFELERSVGGYKTNPSDHRPLKPLIDTDRGYATGRFMLELLEVSAPETLTLSWEGQVSLLREGRVAMAYEWASRAAQLSGFASAGDLGFLPHPSGPIEGEERVRANVAPIGGFAFGIPANIASDRLKTAWNAIEWMSSPEVVKLLAQHGGYVTPRISVAADPDVRQLSPMIEEVDRMSRRGQIRLWPRPPVASYSTVVSILGEEIHQMLRGKQSVEEALCRSQQRAEAI
ncbi:sugar ABC transporter substrate-binding protein [Shimia sp.]|uniref:ABC transporter substrate-binding protein n=1 Tax=Shimia sp. TaxID=1954381 RepID=UPI003299F0B6